MISVEYPTTEGPTHFLTPKIYLPCPVQRREVPQDALAPSVLEPFRSHGNTNIQLLETRK